MLAESLPGKLYHYWLHSAIFSLLQRMYRAVRHVYLHSGAHALLTHESAVQRAYASSLFARLLRTLFQGILWLCGRILDFFGRVPKSLAAGDPNYATVLLSNLGSIRSPAVYHHLNNYGTNSILVTIGTIHKKEVFREDGSRTVRDIVDVGITLDERIADGFYFGRSWKIVQHLLAHPELLDRPLKEEIDFEC